MLTTNHTLKLIGAALLAIAILIPAQALASHRFTDVGDNHPFHDSISAIADAGVTLGCDPDGTQFCPSGFVTRSQMAAFMDRLGALSAGSDPVVNAAFLDGHGAGAFVRPIRPSEGCAAIQEAIDTLPADGGEVVLGAGTFTCSAPVVIDSDHVSLRGSGAATLLRLASGANSPLLIIGDITAEPATTHHDISVSDLRLDGNKTGQPDECWGGPCTGGYLLPIRNNALTIRRSTDVSIERVVGFDAASGGLVVERGSRRIHVHDFEAHGNVFDGLAAYLTEESVFRGLHLHDNGAAGLSFDDEFNHNIVSDAVLTDNGTVGIFMRYSTGNVFSALQIRGSGEHGVFIAHVDGAANAATNNTFSGLSVSGSAEWAVFVANTTNTGNVITGARYHGNGSGCLFEAAGGLVVTAGTVCS